MTRKTHHVRPFFIFDLEVSYGPLSEGKTINTATAIYSSPSNLPVKLAS